MERKILSELIFFPKCAMFHIWAQIIASSIEFIYHKLSFADCPENRPSLLMPTVTGIYLSLLILETTA